ncbi:MAG: hypothetical protein M3Y07_02530 [Acidobacteriota bacterium]|nr:hypothetical protein [Acidobacteriota bacterium]
MRPTNALDKIISIAVLVTCLIVSGISISSALQRSAWSQREPQEGDIGRHIHITGVQWKSHKASLVLVLNTQCHFCDASVPFYRSLTELESRNMPLALVAVFPQAKEDVTLYTARKALKFTTVITDQGDLLGAAGTPTIFLIDSFGIVRNRWQGLLKTEQINDVVKTAKELLGA